MRKESRYRNKSSVMRKERVNTGINEVMTRKERADTGTKPSMTRKSDSQRNKVTT